METLQTTVEQAGNLDNSLLGKYDLLCVHVTPHNTNEMISKTQPNRTVVNLQRA